MTAISVALCWAKWLSLPLLSLQVSQKKKKREKRQVFHLALLSPPYLIDTNFHMSVHISPITLAEQLVCVLSLTDWSVFVYMCEHRGLACVCASWCKQVIEHDVFKAPAFCIAQPPHPSQGRQDLQANLLRIQRRRKWREKYNIVKMKSEPSTLLFLYFPFQHLKAEDQEMKKGMERAWSKKYGWRQRGRKKDAKVRESDSRTDTTEESWKRVMGKGKWTWRCRRIVFSWGYSSIPYLMDLVWSAWAKPCLCCPSDTRNIVQNLTGQIFD